VFGSLIRRPWFWILVLAAFVAAMMLAACGDPQQSTPIACATWQAPDGTWMEEDNEEVDSDPCDLDDMFEKPRTTKPVPKASPARPNVRSTRR